MSDDLVSLCALSDLIEDEGFPVEVNGRQLAVWLIEGEVYVTSDICTHGEASLSRDGAVDGFEVVCGLHMGAFDVRTGTVTSAPCHIPLETFPAVVEDDRVYIRRPA